MQSDNIPPAPNTADAPKQDEIFDPFQLSRSIYSELTGQTLYIKFKQINLEFVNNLLSEIKISADDLAAAGIVDVTILFELSTSKQSYSGSDIETFRFNFGDGECVTGISVTLNGKFEPNKKLHERQISFQASSTLGSTPSYFKVVGDDPTWVRNHFARIKDSFSEKSSNWLVYNKWFELIVQLAAVLVIFGGSLKLAQVVRLPLEVPASHVYVFAGALLFGSNIWTFLSQGLIALREKWFPIVTFRKRTLELWVVRAASGLALLGVAWAVDSILNILF